MDFTQLQDRIAESRHNSTPERCAAFREILTALFEEYPLVSTTEYGFSPEYWRAEALRALGEGGEGAMAAFWASDTGVPNEIIDAAYTLIFG